MKANFWAFILSVLLAGCTKAQQPALPTTTNALATNSANTVAEIGAKAEKGDAAAQIDPSFEGKSLTYWASRVDGLAEESEPALAAIRSMGPEGVNALIRAFRTVPANFSQGQRRAQPWSVHQNAADALRKLGPDSRPAVPVMVEYLRASDPIIRHEAADILGTIGDASQAVIDALIRELEDDDNAYYAMKSLARLGETNIGIIQQLAAKAKGPNPKAAYWSTVSLSELGSASSPVLSDLIECVRRGPNVLPDDQRQAAVQAIALCSTNAVKAVPALTDGLKDSQEWTRKCIYIALGCIGPSASNALPSLQTALTNETNLSARTDIARALWLIDPNQFDSVSAAIKKSLDEGSRELRREGSVANDFLSALDLIGEIGPKAAPFVPELQKYLESQDPSIQFSAAWALLQVSPILSKPAEMTLLHLTGLENYPLEKIGSDEMGRVLSELKRKRDSFPLRIAAAGALWQKSEQLKPAMTHLIADSVRDWDYFTSMQRVIPEENAAVPALQSILVDSAHTKVHGTVREALRMIRGSAGERW
jgi:HEAT repeat protein